MRGFLVALAVGVVLLAGCSGDRTPVEAPPPSYDAAAIAQAAIRELDKNKNGTIEGPELEACPALKSALAALDKNRDGMLSLGEIQQRVQAYAARGTMLVTCTVTLDAQPFVGAGVTFEPEKFMGNGLKTATATTDKDGTCAAFAIDGRPFTSLPAGFYRIRVTKEGMKLPARYNTQTTLGCEVFADPRQGEATIDLLLTSR